MGCKEYELLKDTVKSKAGRVFIYDDDVVGYTPKDLSRLNTGKGDTYEWFTQEQVEDAKWLRPVEEKEEEPTEKTLPAKLVKSYIEGVLNEALDRGIEYATKQGDDKTYISETRISFNVAECVLQAMKAKT